MQESMPTPSEVRPLGVSDAATSTGASVDTAAYYPRHLATRASSRSL